MCGLFGSWGPQPLPLPPVLEALGGRGPDDRGEALWPLAAGWLQLAHTRLAIQDLSAAGHQPMGSVDGRRWIVFNGEIYNAPELRRELARHGLSLRSHSDTEVILEGHGLWGDALWPRLNGIFAVALIDLEQGELTLARDRFGVKPLLWHRSADGFAFGSELSAFRAAAIPEHPRLDPQALEDYWQWGSVLAPRTLVEGIHVFPPGCTARWQVGSPGDRWELQRFAGLPETALSPNDLSYGEAVRACREALEQAVQRQLLADVPVGAFLSGGLDSAAIVALMRRGSATVPHTFSLGFEQGDGPGRGHRVADERPLARLVAEQLGTDHHELVIGAAEAIAAFPEFCRAIDQPSVDGFNTFLVTRAARRHDLRVALSGLGGDELLAGYPVFQRAWRFQQAPQTWRAWQGRLPWRLQQRLGWQAARFRRGTPEALAAHRRLQPPRHRSPSSEGQGWALSEAALRLDPIAQLSRLELQGYLHNTLLRDSDAVTMHQGLELRVPFLDHPLVELLLRLPSAYKIRAGCNKPLLIDALGAELPEAILQAPKRGFELPFGAWLAAMPAPALDPEALGGAWPARVRRARRLHHRSPARYQGWWQWQVLAHWLEAWPQLLSQLPNGESG